ncbi:MAG: hypothetical protein GF341_11230 [candidate division Zixibacteria bacterium]|nr:hypothetical protein [candidate division Zixibacteria bacterium]
MCIRGVVLRSVRGGVLARSFSLIAVGFLLTISLHFSAATVTAGPASLTAPIGPEHLRSSVNTLQVSAQKRWEVRWESTQGLPRSIAGGLSVRYDGEPVDIARQFARDHRGLFGLSETAAPVSVDVLPVRQQQLPGGDLVTLQQTVNGIPVVDARIAMVVSDGAVRHVSSSAIQVSVPITVTPSVSIPAAITNARHAIDPSLPHRVVQKPELAVLADPDPTLAYEVFVSVNRGYWEPWQILVDASSGAIVRQRPLIQEATGTGRVFDPNPVVSLADVSLRDENDAASAVPSAGYHLVTLENLDEPVAGVYTLGGLYVRLVNKSIPTNVAPTSTTGSFLYWRDHDAFEEVMAYYTIDRNQAYIQSLGFYDINNRPIEVDAHALFGWDNSFYTGSPVGAGYIQFGDGGVDDAEDADIILHEYGHAIQDNSNPGVFFGSADNGYGNETGAMAEGFCDFWAASATYDSSVAHIFPPEFFGEWNAKGLASGPAHYLRLVNTDKTYPGDMVGKIHADGEIWSATLWEMFEAIGRGTTDRIVLYSHFLLPTDPDFADGAQALLDADALLHPVVSGPDGPIAGEHYNIICGIASSRGILSCSPICDCSEHGNAYDDAYLDLVDILTIADEAFMGADPAPTDPLCPHLNRADYNCDGFVDAEDISLAVDYVFRNGNPPCDPCE